jgi:hypothetical protein
MSPQLNSPQSWTTGTDEPTEKQTSFLKTLAEQKGVHLDPTSLNKSEASAKINELKSKDTQNADVTAGEPIQDPKTWGESSKDVHPLAPAFYLCLFQTSIYLHSGAWLARKSHVGATSIVALHLCSTICSMGYMSLADWTK